MKTLITIIALFIGLQISAQEATVYVCHFQDQQTASQIISQVDTLAIAVANPQPSITGYSQNLLNSDSTAIYEDGIFYNVITYVDLPVLDEYVIYPCKMKQRWTGIKESQYKLKK